MDIRIGFGYDIHKLVQGRELFLGGLKIPSDAGLTGHSDADVLLHAISDAILGALSLGDIGEHFPDTDESIKGISSTEIITAIRKMASFGIVNIDSTIIAEAPILSPYKKQIQESVAHLLDVDIQKISIKAKRNEGFGPIGAQEAIACYAIALLQLR